jgi:hypothetical protein
VTSRVPRPHRFAFEPVLAACTVAISALAARSVSDATEDLDARLASRATELDRLAAAQDRLTELRDRPDCDVLAEFAPTLAVTSLPTLFAGRRVVLHGSEGRWSLGLEPGEQNSPRR